MIKDKKDLERAKRAYAKAGFVYMGKEDLGNGRFKHVWARPHTSKKAGRPLPPRAR